MTKDQERLELLVRVARLYYEHNLSQNEIADKINLSRSYVSKLLNEARINGIVEVRVHDPAQTESAAERALREYYGLRHVIIVPADDQVGWLHRVGEATARYIDTIINKGDILGLTWGETVYECAKAMPLRDGLGNPTILQLCGGISNTRKKVYVSEIVQTLSYKLDGNGYVLPFPAIVTSKAIKEILDEEPVMKEVLVRAKNANILIMTVGAIGPRCGLCRAGYLQEDEIDKLIEKGAVGDICTHIINRQGKICDEELDARTVAVPLEDILRIDTRICAAVGESKVEGVLAALEGGITNVLVTNEDMVEMIRTIKPEIFKSM